MLEHKFANGCTFVVDAENKHCKTIMPDGKVVHATATADQEPFAKELGYDNAWQMVVHHEFLHTWVNDQHGKVSQVLSDVANGIPADNNHWQEESQVLLLQKAINAVKHLNQ
jgi:hypothetical protein